MNNRDLPAKAGMIKAAREVLGLNQLKLAEELGITKDHVNRLENGRSKTFKQTELAIECLLRRKKRWPLK